MSARVTERSGDQLSASDGSGATPPFVRTGRRAVARTLVLGAAALGLTIPPAVLARADEVIACPDKAGASSGC